jgi:hypothetical protein
MKYTTEMSSGATTYITNFTDVFKNSKVNEVGIQRHTDINLLFMFLLKIGNVG